MGRQNVWIRLRSALFLLGDGCRVDDDCHDMGIGDHRQAPCLDRDDVDIGHVELKFEGDASIPCAGHLGNGALPGTMTFKSAGRLVEGSQRALMLAYKP